MHFISEFTQKAVAEVFETMLNLQVEVIRTCAGTEMPQDRVSGVVGSIGMAGRINGTLHMHYSSELACAITERMMGSPPAGTHAPEVADVVGELSNMVCGTIKRHAAQRGYDAFQSLPTVLRGEHIMIEGKGAPIAIFNLFRITELRQELAVRVFIKLDT